MINTLTTTAMASNLFIAPHLTDSLWVDDNVVAQLTRATTDAQSVGTVFSTAARGLWLTTSSELRPTLGSGGGRNSFLDFAGSKKYTIASAKKEFSHLWCQRKGTIALFVRMPSGSDGATKVILDSCGTTTASTGLSVYRSPANKLVVFLAKSVAGTPILTLTSTGNVTASSGWVPVVFTIDGNNASLWVGSDAAVTTSSATAGLANGTPSTGDLTIGATTSAGFQFSGQLGTLAISHEVWTTRQVNEWKAYDPARTSVSLSGAIGTGNDPRNFTMLADWLDFSDRSTLFTDAALTSPVLNSGDAVRAAVNKAALSSGRNATAASDSVRPVWYGSMFNGCGAVKFDGVDDNLAVPANPSGTAWTRYIVAKNLDMVKGSHFESGSAYVVQTGDNYAGAGAGLTNPYVVWHITGSDTPNYGPVDNGSAGLNIIELTRDGSNVTLIVNGKHISNRTNNDIYSAYQLGIPYNVGWDLDGYYCERLTYYCVHTPKIRGQIRRYLRDKWGIANVQGNFRPNFALGSR